MHTFSLKTQSKSSIFRYRKKWSNFKLTSSNKCVHENVKNSNWWWSIVQWSSQQCVMGTWAKRTRLLNISNIILYVQIISTFVFHDKSFISMITCFGSKNTIIKFFNRLSAKCQLCRVYRVDIANVISVIKA